MSAKLIQLHPRTVAADRRDELTALLEEGLDFGVWVVSLARLAQVRLSRGCSPADLLDELERAANRQVTRLTAAAAAAQADGLCPDGVEVRRSGHGAAA